MTVWERFLGIYYERFGPASAMAHRAPSPWAMPIISLLRHGVDVNATLIVRDGTDGYERRLGFEDIMRFSVEDILLRDAITHTDEESRLAELLERAQSLGMIGAGMIPRAR